MPTTRKVMRAKALKTLDRVLVYKDHEDTALMKRFIEKKMAEHECDALDIAAAFLKEAVGDLGQDIEEDDFVIRKPVKGRGDREQARGRRSGRDAERGRGRDAGLGNSGRSGRGQAPGRRDLAAGRDEKRSKGRGVSNQSAQSKRGGREGFFGPRGDRKKKAVKKEV